MAGVNKVLIIGHLGQDPEVRYLPRGGAVTSISVATSESWNDKQTGERKEKTEWHRVVMFRKLAEIAGEYLKKGASVYIEGKLQTRKWADDNGVERYTTEIVADTMQMLGGKSNTEENGSSVENNGYKKTNPTKSKLQQANAPDPAMDFDDDIPF